MQPVVEGRQPFLRKKEAVSLFQHLRLHHTFQNRLLHSFKLVGGVGKWQLDAETLLFQREIFKQKTVTLGRTAGIERRQPQHRRIPAAAFVQITGGKPAGKLISH